MDLPRIDFDKGRGLVPVVVIDAATMQPLMLAYTNREALERTLETGYAHFYSRSRSTIWLKGATSGSRIRVLRVEHDCDSDSLVYYGIPEGPVCHTGSYSCFSRPLHDSVLETLWSLVVEAFEKAVLYRRPGVGGLARYLYVVNPLTDNIPPPHPLLQSLVSMFLASHVKERVDKVVSLEALGLPIASLVAQRLGAPLAIVRKRKYPVKGLESPYSSGYEAGTHYIYGVEAGEKVAVVDDAVSTGGAMISVIEAMQKNGIDVARVLSTIAKPQYGGLEKLRSKGFELVRVVDVFIEQDNKLRIIQPLTGWEKTIELPVV
ncbi:MAG: hypothetical protein F7C07_06715 [Desulfurococcales archaeon]|nr:hypothetical protein [Desulfurococcales archaeon]